MGGLDIVIIIDNRGVGIITGGGGGGGGGGKKGGGGGGGERLDGVEKIVQVVS